MKVTVNERIGQMLIDVELINKDCSLEWKIYKFLKKVESYRNFCQLMGDFFEENNIKVSHIEQAFTHGWKTEYEFKTGDILWNKGRNAMTIVSDEAPKHIEANYAHSNYVNDPAFKGDYVLICKAKNREDLGDI